MHVNPLRSLLRAYLPTHEGEGQVIIGGGCVAGPLFSYPGAFLAASRAFVAIAAVLPDTRNGHASGSREARVRGG